MDYKSHRFLWKNPGKSVQQRKFPVSICVGMSGRKNLPVWFERERPAPRAPRFRAVSLFSGCGGFCEGIKRSGFDIACAVELDPFACETYSRNFPAVPLFRQSITDFLAPDPVDHVTQFGLTDIDMVFGGPPCQGFSQIGPRRLDDVRNTLYQEYARVVETLKPRIFLMENVPNLVQLQGGHFRDLIISKFRSIGYANTTFIKVTASDFGVPQERKRVIFVGTRNDISLGFDLHDWCVAFLKKIYVQQPFTVREAIDDLPPRVTESGKTLPYRSRARLSAIQRLMRLDHDCGFYPQTEKQGRLESEKLLLHNHHTKEIQARRMKLISHLKPGFKGDSLPRGIWNGLRPEKWRRLHPDRPAYTILAQMHRDLSEWVHPSLERWITVREAARLQSFHDGFIFMGSEWQQLKQIGNAVPPLLGAALGKMALSLLKVCARRPLPSFVAPIQSKLRIANNSSPKKCVPTASMPSRQYSKSHQLSKSSVS